MTGEPAAQAGRLDAGDALRREKLRARVLVELTAIASTSRGTWGHPDPESAHADADNLLLELIDDAEIIDAYDRIRPKLFG